MKCSIFEGSSHVSTNQPFLNRLIEDEVWQYMAYPVHGINKIEELISLIFIFNFYLFIDFFIFLIFDNK